MSSVLHKFCHFSCSCVCMFVLEDSVFVCVCFGRFSVCPCLCFSRLLLSSFLKRFWWCCDGGGVVLVPVLFVPILVVAVVLLSIVGVCFVVLVPFGVGVLVFGCWRL